MIREEEIRAKLESTMPVVSRDDVVYLLNRLQFMTDAYDTNAKVHEALTRDYVALKDENARLRTELSTLKTDIEAGRLVRLPFKPGDTLYAIIPKICQMDCDTHVSPWKSIAAAIYEDGSIAAVDGDENIDKVGTSYAYLTEAEALAAMKEDAHESHT